MATKLHRASASFIFYYDVVCPFAYMASTVVEGLAKRCGVRVDWTPVLLGGLYGVTQASQGKEGSATDVMSPAKLKIIGHDLHRQMLRRGIPYREPVSHPQKSVTAMRLLSAITDNAIRAGVSHNLYKAYWYQQNDVTDLAILQDAVEPFGLIASKLLESPDASLVLRANTTEASKRGAFGVPSFFVGEKLYWGTDRMFFVERALGLNRHPERITSPPKQGAASLTFFFDISSPWSFLAMERLNDIVASVFPVAVKIEWVPILVGALFKEIGTPVVPGAAMNETKRAYYQKDLLDWCSYAGVKLNWPDVFPLRTVLPLRVILAANCDPSIITHIFHAAWLENKNIGDPKVLQSVLEAHTISSKALVKAAEGAEIKKRLFANTRRAVEEGVCGVPSFQVNGGEIVWGQDKLNIVADMICGWKPTTSAKL